MFWYYLIAVCYWIIVSKYIYIWYQSKNTLLFVGKYQKFILKKGLETLYSIHEMRVTWLRIHWWCLSGSGSGVCVLIECCDQELIPITNFIFCSNF